MKQLLPAGLQHCYNMRRQVRGMTSVSWQPPAAAKIVTPLLQIKRHLRQCPTGLQSARKTEIVGMILKLNTP